MAMMPTKEEQKRKEKMGQSTRLTRPGASTARSSGTLRASAPRPQGKEETKERDQKESPRAKTEEEEEARVKARQGRRGDATHVVEITTLATARRPAKETVSGCEPDAR